MSTEKLQRDRGTKKLTEEQVIEMRRLKKKGYSFGRLGEMFGVHPVERTANEQMDIG